MKSVVFEKSEILNLSECLSSIYIEVIDSLSSKSFAKNSLSQDFLKIVFRRPVISITHLFFERLIRLNKLTKNSTLNLAVPQKIFYKTPNSLEEINELIKTEEFNNSIISLLGEIWGIKKSKSEAIKVEYPSNLFTNHLFTTSKRKFSLANIMYVINRLLDRVVFFKRFPVIGGFANSEKAFYKHFFYTRYFKKVNDDWAWRPVDIDQKGREEIFNKINIKIKGVHKLLDKYKFSRKQKDLIIIFYFEFLKSLFPLQLIENLENNYYEAKKSLLPFSKKVIFLSSSPTMRTTFILGVAKDLGYKLVDVQHGGHYGYSKNNFFLLEGELLFYDEFITWGWKILPKHPLIKSIQTYPLPSPWLSERKIFWKALRIEKSKSFDILWMPDLIKRHVGEVQGPATSQRDFVDEISVNMINFIKIASKYNCKIYCKPYNSFSFYVMQKTYASMTNIGKNFFTCDDKFDKGLNYELLEKCKLVLWDQPGTGFLECIACGIPTMVLRFGPCFELEDWCIKDFLELEKVGVIHQKPESLLKEMQIFLKNPILWMNCSSRKSIVTKFSKKYALVDEKWWLLWRNYLRAYEK